MILMNFILGLIAGLILPKLTPLALEALPARLAQLQSKVDANGTVTVLLCLMAVLHAAFAFVGGESSVFMMCVGVFCGLYGKDIFAFLTSKDKDADY